MLKGTLDDFTLPDIFRLLSMAKRTGSLEVTRSAGSGKVFFRSGDVYFAESSLTREPLGQKLIRARAITDGQLMKALDEHATEGRRVGEILVESDLVSLDQLETAVREQIEDSVFDLLRWELGEFEWEPEIEASVEVPITVSVENLIMEASRRLDELEVIKRKIPSADAVLHMAPKAPEDAVEINITPEEWRVLVLVDGTRSVSAIAEAVSLDEFGAMRILYGLVSAGLIELTPGSDAVEPVELDEVQTDASPPRSSRRSRRAEQAPFSVEVDLSPHSDGDKSEDPPAPPAPEVEAAEVVTATEVGPAFVPDDLLDEPTDSLLSDLSAGTGLAADAIDLIDAATLTVETFDAPADGDVTTDLPAAPEELDTSVPAEPAAPATEPAEPEATARIDRAAVVRELAGLFNDEDRPRAQRAGSAGRQSERGQSNATGDGPPVTPHRVEDDDQITKGLISRLIDGVKGL